MIIQKHTLYKPHSLVVLFAVAFFIVIFFGSQASASFDPGNITNDNVMSNYGSMSESQIRSFINQKNASCASSNNLCFKNYRENGADAARIIYVAAQEQKINPQVILATIQKEQGLITSVNPAQWMYNSAMGYGCPDSTPGQCGPDQRGFLRQVIWGSTMYRAILDGGGKWGNRFASGSLWYTPYVVGNNSIQWHPSASCGSSTVNIKNRATQALYNYTPYRPNQAALNAGYGTGNSCSSYGNRNFYLYMRDWFNGGVSRFGDLSDVRFMETSRDTSKVDLATGLPIGGTIVSATQIRFTSKSTFNGADCLRTKVDEDRDAAYCIPITDLKEIVINPEPIQPQMMTLSQTAGKYDMRRANSIGGNLPQYRQLNMTGKFTVAGTDYYVTSRDMNEGYEYGFRKSHLVDSTPYTNIDNRLISTTSAAERVVPATGAVAGSLRAGELFTVKSIVTTESGTYYRTTEDHNSQLDVAIPTQATRELSFEPFSSPRWMRIAANTRKFDVVLQADTGSQLVVGREVFFDSKITINNKTYYRTNHDTRNGSPYVIEASSVTGSLLNDFSSFASPRTLEAKGRVCKTDLYTGKTVTNACVASGTTIGFGTKVTRNGTTYYRTNVDTSQNRAWVFRSTDLR